MGLFKRFSNDSNEYVIFNEYKRKLEKILNEDSFISKKCYLGIYNDYNKKLNQLNLTEEQVRSVLDYYYEEIKSLN